MCQDGPGVSQIANFGSDNVSVIATTSQTEGYGKRLAMVRRLPASSSVLPPTAIPTLRGGRLVSADEPEAVLTSAAARLPVDPLQTFA
jgi:hypothetical protein